MVEPLETIESAAKILSLSPWTIRLYVRQGKIRPVRIGRRIAIEQAEIRRLIEEGRDDSSWDRAEAGDEDCCDINGGNEDVRGA